VWIAREELADFSNKVVRLLDDAKVRASLGEAGREYAHGWSASQQAGRMVAFYHAVRSASAVSELSALTL